MCGHCIILGPIWVMLLYILQVIFWVELLVQRRLYSIFVKLWVPVKGTQKCGIGLPNINKFSVDGWSTDPRVLGCHRRHQKQCRDINGNIKAMSRHCHLESRHCTKRQQLKIVIPRAMSRHHVIPQNSRVSLTNRQPAKILP